MLRVFFVLFGISFWLLLIDSPFINNCLRYNIAWLTTARTPRYTRALFSLWRVPCVWRGEGTSSSA